ncbi:MULTISPECIES: hypothetical protein [Ralstonia]|uniref:Uncharacterized protein n=1 Tax=Ralstonia insidiosa TaxID=190721 RepID=A0A848NX44_9RALS|nr:MULTISPECIES: hypothetical protein [Ralstonia]NMV39881.1 hypothetical protein [Ralstonia insidiosa]
MSNQPALHLVAVDAPPADLSTAALSGDQVALAISRAVEASKRCATGYSCTDSSMTQLIAHHLGRELQAVHPNFDLARFMQRCNA